MAVVPLHYRFDGPRHAPAVLLLAPPGVRWTLWEPQMPELTRVLRVLRVNHRGHGASPAPAGDYRLADLGADVLALLDECGMDRLSIVAAGLGGLLATWIAAARPERVRRLAYLAGAAVVPRTQPWAAIAERARSSGMAAVAEGVMRPWFTPSFADDRPDVVTRLADDFARLDPAGFAGWCTAVAGADQRAQLRGVRAPALVVAAAHDPLLPPGHGRRLAAALPSARFASVTGAAHLVGIERADRVNELLMEHIAR
ncbi:alpha/beta fold hydrolase [Streptomonospora nanhaiensis]|uniref:3-oxoadipate enol-lactonase n=1 Tax=Streptomonospora nanhaiensis TaxID=1323731 RepID=A0A853BQC0_9ACTN|nr:alpha/beta fold hydrolase [Streptomonospora nanhaiensis]MBV2365091.1 alpha/beta fold hydrolase [Streptomonospora nanhaiensis]MBX9389995.1 alpha/beta fold hydrolase [Streptomonospora nanhaiensis]NYI96701.1 3-oxoadipate enol-lactonase [Streptomonospora nanhaiensis]